MIKNTILKERGFIVADFPLPPIILTFLEEAKWYELDQYFLEISKTNGLLRNFLSDYLDYDFLEHIIAIRSAPEDEEGIWHDDGSRFLGFSLSLNRVPKSIEGGELRFRKKNYLSPYLDNPIEIFPPLPYGKIVIFLSGVYGFEHMVSAVTIGQRIVIAGWCS